MRSRYLVISPILLGRLSRNRMDGTYHKYLCNNRYNRKSTASAWFIPCVRLQVIVANVKERKNILNPQNLIFLSLFEASTTAALSVRCSKKFHSQVTPSKSLSQAHAFAKHDRTVIPSLRSDYHNTGWGWGGVDCGAAWRHLSLAGVGEGDVALSVISRITRVNNGWSRGSFGNPMCYKFYTFRVFFTLTPVTHDLFPRACSAPRLLSVVFCVVAAIFSSMLISTVSVNSYTRSLEMPRVRFVPMTFNVNMLYKVKVK